MYSTHVNAFKDSLNVDFLTINVLRCLVNEYRLKALKFQLTGAAHLCSPPITFRDRKVPTNVWAHTIL
jgi:hypothetical protein